MVKPVSLKNMDPHDWNRILQVLQQKRKKWSSRLPAEIDSKITGIQMGLLNIANGGWMPLLNL